ncbi:hypothetical protein BRX36_19640 [Sphingomonas sp. S-NIH.Pt1_0416]|uniref:glycosyltransferase family 10 domain-containing protein n=1 Tax=Sphingomonas sp. S-NIH.Pt1_0416 TaxID=1920123 RepID=UPI000F7D9691|nr:glycosyltransferase family 10 [Sphingomonas sp. S-NIH.Pt1_0416]RSU59106.1 hypothetical protein BRX36_19640 [Sphingomonas sp. S-NIH.Pt1_0416]
MTLARPSVNILHRYHHALFAPHFDPERDGFDLFENSHEDCVWDVVIVFEAVDSPLTLRVRRGNLVFISGEPPEIGNHAKAFLRQFDQIFCAGVTSGTATMVSGKQHFNNWHFGYSRNSGYRYDHRYIKELPAPEKNQALSTITSNLNYLPMHIKRRRLIERLAQDYGDKIGIFGRPHRFVEYKEDAILDYRFHLCVENCSVPDLWTEKIADALLSYAVPVYAGCTNIEDYFPGATIKIDLDDYAAARRTIDMILTEGEDLYRAHLPAVIEARRKLIETFDISALARRVLAASDTRDAHSITLRPEAAYPLAGLRSLLARGRRKVRTWIWRQRIARHG